MDSYLDNLGDLSPLLWSWVNAGRIVSAGLEQDDSVLWDFLETRRKLIE